MKCSKREKISDSKNDESEYSRADKTVEIRWVRCTE